MNYYPFHIGDYAAHTAHLEPMEDLAYRRLLDLYYLREEALPADIQVTAKLVRMRSMASDVEAVLKEFFVLTDAGWSHERCDQEVEHMQDKQAKARASAEASVNARRAKASVKSQETLNVGLTVVDCFGNGRSTDAENNKADVELPTPTPTPTPVLEANASVGKLPTCPTQAVIDIYHESLPELPAVKLMNEQRKKAIAGFWKFVLTSKKTDGTPRALTDTEALGWISDYFARARENDFLMGRGAKQDGHAGWQCDLDFLMTDKGKKHVIEKTRIAA